VGDGRKPSDSGEELEKPDSMALIARKTSSLTVFIMSSRSVWGVDGVSVSYGESRMLHTKGVYRKCSVSNAVFS